MSLNGYPLITLVMVFLGSVQASGWMVRLTYRGGYQREREILQDKRVMI